MTRQSVADPAATSLLVNKLIPYSPYQIVKYVAENMDDVKAAATNVDFINVTAAQVRADRNIVVAARDQIIPIQSQILALMDDVTIDAEKASQARDQAEDYAYMLGTTSLGYYYTSLAEGAAASAEGEAYFVIDAESRAYWGIRQDGIGVKTAELITVAIGGASVMEAKGYRDQAAASAALAVSTSNSLNDFRVEVTQLGEDLEEGIAHVDTSLASKVDIVDLANPNAGTGAEMVGIRRSSVFPVSNVKAILERSLNAADIGIRSDTPDATSLMQTVMNFAAANGYVLYLPGFTINVTQLVIPSGLTMRGNKRLTRFQHIPGTTAPMWVINNGPSVDVCLSDFGCLGNGLPGEHIFDLIARESSGGSNGGLWYSDFNNIWVLGQGGKALKLTGDNDPVVGVSDCPHQFLEFKNCRFGNMGDGVSRSVSITGKVNQVLFEKCDFSSNNTNNRSGYNVVASREWSNGDAADAAIANAVTPGSATPLPGNNTGHTVVFKNCTNQNSGYGYLIDTFYDSRVDGCDMENLYYAITAQGAAAITVLNCNFRNAASNGSGGGYGILASSASVFVGGNQFQGTVDMRDRQSGSTGSVFRIAPDRGASGNGTTSSGLTPTLSVSLSAVDIGSKQTAQITGSNTTPPEISNITSQHSTGTTITLRITGGCLVFLTGGNILVTKRTVYRAGEIINLTRLETGWAITSGYPALLEAASIPTSGYYEAGEWIRSTALFAAGTVTLGWKRLTTGTAHVAGTDWRAVNVTAV